jgi:hypothetical protein
LYGAKLVGTDISIYLERKESGRWVLAAPMVPNEEYHIEAPELGPALRPQALYWRRNYSLFAILGDDVHNPIRSDSKYEIISAPRGLPADTSEGVRSWHDWSEHWFGESWLALEELLSFDWQGKTIVKRAMVEARFARLFGDETRGFPYDTWPKDEPISVASQMRDGIEVKWTETYYQSAGPEFIQILREWGDFCTPGTVRIVFWFSH